MAEIQEIQSEGFDLPAREATPGCRVILIWQLNLSSTTWIVEGYLHWDRHEGEKTSRAPRWRYTREEKGRKEESRCWSSFTGRDSVSSQGGLSKEELDALTSMKEEMRKKLSERKKALDSAGNLIDQDAEERWQLLRVLGKKCRNSKELFALREQIEQDRRAAGPEAAPEWRPPRISGAVGGPPRGAKKRGCDAIEWFLIHRTRESPRQSQKGTKRRRTDTGAEVDSSSEEEVIEKGPRRPPISAFKGGDAARNELEPEEARQLWKRLENDEVFTSEDDLLRLWRLALAKTAVEEDGQLPFTVMDLAKQQVEHRAHLAFTGLAAVVEMASDALSKKDLVTTFLKVVLRELLNRVFNDDHQGHFLPLSRFKGHAKGVRGCARQALRGSTSTEVAAGFGVLVCSHGMSQIVPEIFQATEPNRHGLAALAFGALLVAEPTAKTKVLQLLLEMLSADCFDLLTRFDLWALLKSLQDEEVDMALTKIQVPRLPSATDDLRALPGLPQLLLAWQPIPGTGPIIAADQLLKDLREKSQDLALLQAALVYFSREAASSFSRGGASDLEAACFAAAREGLFFLCRQQWLQSKQYSCQASVAHSVANCLALSPRRDMLLRVNFRMSDGKWPSCSSSPIFDRIFRQLEGKAFADLFKQEDLRKHARTLIRAYLEKRGQSAKETVEKFARWGLGWLTGDSQQTFLLKLPPPPVGERLKFNSVAEELENRSQYANQICELLFLMVRQLSEEERTAQIKAACAFSALQEALLALCRDCHCQQNSRDLLRQITGRNVGTGGYLLNEALTAAKEVPMPAQNWVFSCFARDLHRLMLWLQLWRPLSGPHITEKIHRLWSVAALANRHLKGLWPALPQCPHDFQLMFNPLMHRSWPGSSQRLDDETWALRPLSAVLAYKNPPGSTIHSWDALLKAAEDLPFPCSWGSFAEALSGSDWLDWARLRKWREAVLDGLSDLEQKHLRAVIFSRVSSIHTCVARRQQSRGQPAVQRMLNEVIHDCDFLPIAMKEYRQLCKEEEPWSKEGRRSISQAQLWSFRGLLYFRNALQQLGSTLAEQGHQLDDLKRGLQLLHRWVELIGFAADESPRESHQQTVEALRRAGHAQCPESEDAGITWEEIAPPATREDGCCPGASSGACQWSEIYHLFVARAAPISTVKDGQVSMRGG